MSESSLIRPLRKLRLFCLALVLAWVGTSAASRLVAPPAHAASKGKSKVRKGKAPPRLLFFTRSQGFEHSTVTAEGNQQPFAYGVLSALATANGWVIDHTKDGGVFTPEGLAPYDAILFLTTGDLTQKRLQKDGTPYPDDDPNQKPMTPAGKQALLDAVSSGKGFVAFHNGADTFHSAGDREEAQCAGQIDPYIKMLGGEFIRHGKQQAATIKLLDPGFPGLTSWPKDQSITEEWYSFKNQSSDLHVIMALDTEGMEGNHYERPPYPVVWARHHGKGRVFYSALGHREEVWTRPDFQQMTTGALKWVLGLAGPNRVDPTIDKVTPAYQTLGTYKK